MRRSGPAPDAAWLVAQDRHRVSLVGQQVGQQHPPAPGQMAHMLGHRHAVQHVTQVEQAGGEPDRQRPGTRRQHLHDDQLGGPGETTADAAWASQGGIPTSAPMP